MDPGFVAGLAGGAILGWIIGGYFLAFATWLFYLSSMALLARKDEMSMVARYHAYPIIAIGLALDFLLQMVVGTIAFLDWPREWLLSPRLSRYRHDPDETWRRDLACWICRNLLDQFDPHGQHC